MKKFLIIAFAMAFAACAKLSPEPTVTQLEEKTLSEEAATFMVLFKGDGVWGVSASDDWIHVSERWYRGEAAFEVRCDSNESSIGDHRFCRVGKVFVSSWDGSRRDEVVIRQEGLVPVMTLSPVTIGTAAGSYSMPMESNLTDRERSGLSFSSDASWISNLAFGRDGESVVFSAAAGSGRSATVNVRFTDMWGREFMTSSTVTQ